MIITKRLFWKSFWLLLAVHFLDLVTTWFFIKKGSIENEKNQAAVWFMQHFGILNGLIIKGILIDVIVIYLVIYLILIMFRNDEDGFTAAIYTLFIFGVFVVLNNWIRGVLGWI